MFYYCGTFHCAVLDASAHRIKSQFRGTNEITLYYLYLYLIYSMIAVNRSFWTSRRKIAAIIAAVLAVAAIATVVVVMSPASTTTTSSTDDATGTSSVDGATSSGEGAEGISNYGWGID